MGYFVGKYQMRVGDQLRVPGEPLPEAVKFPNLRELLANDHIRCDYKDGETHWTKLPPVSRSNIVSEQEMAERISKATGVQVGSGLPYRELARVYRALVAGEPLPTDVDFLKPAEPLVPPEHQETERLATEALREEEKLLADMMAVDEDTHLNRLRGLLKKAGFDEAAKWDKETCLAQIREIVD